MASLTTLVNNNPETELVKIVDMNGNQIEVFSLPARNEQSIDLSERASGIYILQIKGSKIKL